MMGQDWAIETEGLTRDFGDFRAVNQIDLKIKRGKFYGFLGPNGAGKSTTIKMLTGLIAPTAGSIRILGDSLTGEDSDRVIKRKVGVVPEDLSLYDNLTGREFLTFVGRIYDVPKSDLVNRVESLLEVMNLQDQERKLTMEYSHGMKKKLALAAALIAKPELLFLDEPFEGVDAVSSSVLRETLNHFVRGGATIFLTSHVLEVVEKLCTDVAIIANGEIVHEEKMDELIATGTLERRFLEVVGTGEGMGNQLDWLDSDTSKATL
jgi:ABC-2 type transport system ATP-binding protein